MKFLTHEKRRQCSPCSGRAGSEPSPQRPQAAGAIAKLRGRPPQTSIRCGRLAIEIARRGKEVIRRAPRHFPDAGARNLVANDGLGDDRYDPIPLFASRTRGSNAPSRSIFNDDRPINPSPRRKAEQQASLKINKPSHRSPGLRSHVRSNWSMCRQ